MRNSTHTLLLVTGWLTLFTAHAQQFSAMDPLPGPTRDGAISFVIGDRVFAGGGLQSKDFYKLDPLSGHWTQLHDLPGVTVERWFAASFVINGKGYVGLGSDEDTFLNDLWEYEPATDTWTQKAPFPGTARNTVFGFAVNGKGYVCGGVDNDYIYSDIVEYDPVADHWTPRGALPGGPTAFGSAFVIDGYAYVLGGDHGAIEDTDMHRYDPVAHTWTARAPFIGHARQTAVAFTLNGKGWFGLGQSEYTTPYDDLYAYDPATDSWTEQAAFPGGVRCWATACNSADQAYMGMGWDLGAHFYNDWWRMEASVGIADVAAAEPMQLFPVPAMDQLHIRLPGSMRASVDVLDAQGRAVRSGTMVQGQLDLDVHDLAVGEYCVSVRDEHATPLRVRFVKN